MTAVFRREHTGGNIVKVNRHCDPKPLNCRCSLIAGPPGFCFDLYISVATFALTFILGNDKADKYLISHEQIERV